jgi:hypothetical protein
MRIFIFIFSLYFFRVYRESPRVILTGRIREGTVGGYGSPHEKGIDGGEKLAQKRDRNEVTNSRSESKQRTVRRSSI